MVEWRPIADFPDYEVSAAGEVRSFRRYSTGRLMRPMICGNKRKQYRAVTLCGDGCRREAVKVGVLVLETFRGPRPSPQHQACHRDDNQFNDALDNLAWGTASQNMVDKVINRPVKLSRQQAIEIKVRRAAGETGAALAREFKVSAATVCDIFKARIHIGATSQ